MNHPWLNTPEALEAVDRAAAAAVRRMGLWGMLDDLTSEAYVLLTECAQPPQKALARECLECGGSLAGRRRNAKFCSEACNSRAGTRRHRTQTAPAPSGPLGHIGSMWTWPEDKMQAYAVQTVAMRLCNYARTSGALREHAVEDAQLERLVSANTPSAEDVYFAVEDEMRELWGSQGPIVLVDSSYTHELETGE